MSAESAAPAPRRPAPRGCGSAFGTLPSGLAPGTAECSDFSGSDVRLPTTDSSAYSNSLPERPLLRHNLDGRDAFPCTTAARLKNTLRRKQFQTGTAGFAEFEKDVQSALDGRKTGVTGHGHATGSCGRNRALPARGPWPAGSISPSRNGIIRSKSAPEAWRAGGPVPAPVRHRLRAPRPGSAGVPAIPAGKRRQMR